MANVNRKIIAALHDLADDHIYPLSKPAEEDPDTYIVFNPEVETPEDFGDDEDHEWLDSIQVHWFAKGRVNYLETKKRIRNRLKAAGFTISEISVIAYEEGSGYSTSNQSGQGYTHLCFTCNIPEDDPYGAS